MALVDRLSDCGIYLRHIDLGGGLGVRYRDEEPPLAGDYIKAVRERIDGRDLALVFEPGRFIVANAGVLLTQVEYLKHTEHKDFAIVDAAMNDLIRPALYQAWMDVTAVRPRNTEARAYDIVGPICETGALADRFGAGRVLVGGCLLLLLALLIMLLVLLVLLLSGRVLEIGRAHV